MWTHPQTYKHTETHTKKNTSLQPASSSIAQLALENSCAHKHTLANTNTHTHTHTHAHTASTSQNCTEHSRKSQIHCKKKKKMQHKITWVSAECPPLCHLNSWEQQRCVSSLSGVTAMSRKDSLMRPRQAKLHQAVPSRAETLNANCSSEKK